MMMMMMMMTVTMTTSIAGVRVSPCPSNSVPHADTRSAIDVVIVIVFTVRRYASAAYMLWPVASSVCHTPHCMETG